MAAKESAEMRQALILVAQNVPVKDAAKQAGVHKASLYGKLKQLREEGQIEVAMKILCGKIKEL